MHQSSSEKLFREEVAERSRERLTGNVVLSIPIAWHIISLMMFSLLVCAIIYLVLAEYTRGETVTGTILPDKGISAILPTRKGTVAALYVSEGQLVAAGAKIASIRVEEDGPTDVSPAQRVEVAVEKQYQELSSQLNSNRMSAKARLAQLEAQKKSLVLEIMQMDVQLDIQEKLIRSSRYDLEKVKEVAERGFISTRDMRLREDQLLVREQGLAQLKQALEAKRGELSETRRSVEVISAQTEAESASIQAARYQVAQRAAQAASDRSYTIRAPVGGKVTALTARVGSPAQQIEPLMVIVPSGARLRAELAVPSSAIGFLRRGQDVRLAVDAFPYQRFGLLKGRIESVSESSLSPNVGSQTSVTTYPVAVTLDSLNVSAYGKKRSLMPGMTVTARIVTERQSLAKWLFDPVFAVSR